MRDSLAPLLNAQGPVFVFSYEKNTSLFFFAMIPSIAFN